ncbi:MAG: TolC family protein [Puia sp.]|nr:TolC family protein [Puia sp.]
MSVAICVGLFNKTANAQQDTAHKTSSVVWDLQACLAYAQKNNIQINTLRLSAQTSEQAYLLSKAARLPNLSASLGQTATHSTNANPVVGGFQTQSTMAGSYSVNSAVTLYEGGYLRDDIRQKNLELQSANLNILQSENDITLQITQAYLNILLAKENLVYVRDLVNSTTAQVEQGRKEYDAGSIARNAYIELQAQLATDKYTLVTAQNAVRQNKLTLKQLLQLPISDTLDIAQPDTVIALEAVPALDQVESAALQNRPEIRNGQLGIDISRYTLAKARAGYLPTLTAAGSLSSGYSNNQSIDYFQQVDNNFFQRIGLTLSIPIFTNRANKTNVENAKIGIAQSRLTLLNVQTTLSQSIEQAYINVLNAQSQYDAALEQLEANREGFRIAGVQLSAGAVNLVDYLQQKTLYVQAFQAYIQAKYNAALSIRIYDFYMGIAIKI